MNNFAFLSRRIRQYWPLWLVLFAGALLSVTLLALAPLLSETVLRIGLQNRLAENEDVASHIRLSTRIDPSLSEFAELDLLVQETVAERFGEVILQVVPNAQTAQFFPWVNEALVSNERVNLRFYDPAGLEESVRFIEGGWTISPTVANAVATVVGVDTAEHYGLAVGDLLPLSRRDNEIAPTHQFVVAGIIEPIEADSAYWFGRFSPLLPFDDGRFDAEYSFLIPQAEFFQFASAELPDNDLFVSWYILIDPDISLENVNELTGLISEWRQVTLQRGSLRVDTTLDATFSDYLGQAALVRPPLLLLLGIVVMVGVYFVLLIGTLILIIMRPEFAKLHSRGASLVQLFQLQMWEALFIVLVAALIGPLLAWLIVLSLTRYGSLAAAVPASLIIAPSLSSWLFAAVGGLIVLGSLLLPVPVALRRSIVEHHSRAPENSVWQRYYLDLFALVIGIILMWRLELFGSFIGALSGPTSLRVDWLLLLTPILLLVAMTTVLARLFPPLLAVMARWAGNARGLAPALALWHAARNPQHVTRLLLLVAMATGLGIIASSLNSTLNQNELNRAEFTVGANQRLVTTSHIPVESEGSRVWRGEGIIDLSNRRGDSFEMIAVEPDDLEPLLSFRDDFADLPLERLMESLQEGVAPVYVSPPFTILAGSPEQFELQVRFHNEALRPLIPRFAFEVKLRTADGKFVMVHLTPPIDLPEEPGWVTFAGMVPEQPDEALPLEMLSLWFRVGDSVWILPDDSPVIDNLMSIDQEGNEQLVAGFEVVEGEQWHSLESSLIIHPNVEWQQSGEMGLTLSFGFQKTVVGFWNGLHPWAGDLATVLPVLVTPRFLESSGLEVGDSVAVQINSRASNSWRPMRFEIVAVVDAFPTMADEEPAGSVIIWQTPLLNLLNTETHGVVSPNELWQANAPVENLAPLISSSSYNESVESVVSRLRALPASIGLRVVTQLGFFMAILFAVASIGSYLFLTARQSEGQYAVLQALGMSERQLYSSLILEQIVLILAGLLFGTAVGLSLTRIFLNGLPLFLGDALAKPDFVVVTDWSAIAIVYLVVISAASVTVLSTVMLLRRQQIQGALRRVEATV